MDCRGFDDRLDALLDGGLAAGERATFEAHAAGCPRCGKLLSLLSAELDVDQVEAPEGLAETVLERTSGAPCARAQELACDLADGVLDPADAELARLHLDRCPECGPIARALARLREDLPGLAEAAPGEGFVESVLARTSRSWPRRMERWRERVAYGFNRLLTRPRFAAEGAYLGSLVLTALVAVPGSPFRGLPARALAATRVPITAQASALAEPVAELKARAGELGGLARESFEKRLAGPVQTVEKQADGAVGAIRALGSRLGHLVANASPDGDTSGTETTTPSREEAKEEKEKKP